MALSKTIATDFGIDATYWHIYAIDTNRLQEAMQVTLAGYVTAEVRSAGHRPIATVNLLLSGPDYPGTNHGVDYATVYGTIKAAASRPGAAPELGAFSGAADM